MKKIFSILFIIIFILLLNGCGAKKVEMNVLSADDSYHYENADLGFSIVLPKEFIYYQTQRKKNDLSTDLEFFVPTNDLTYAQEVSGYAKPITIKIFADKTWNNLSAADVNKKEAVIIEQKGGKIYVLKFWPKPPADWQGKWTEDMQEKIIKGIKLK